MKKSELTKLIESLKDDDDIDEILTKSEIGKSLASSGLTLDAFKSKLLILRKLPNSVRIGRELKHWKNKLRNPIKERHMKSCVPVL